MTTYYTTRAVYADGRESANINEHETLNKAISSAQTDAAIFSNAPVNLGIVAMKIDRCERIETVQTIPVLQPVLTHE